MSQSQQAETETFVRRTYAEVLRKDETDLDPNRDFLRLGGDSLLAVFVVARCRDAGYSVEIADVFRGGSVFELSRKICAQRPTTTSDGVTNPTTTTTTTTTTTAINKYSTQDSQSLPLTSLQRNYVAARWTQTCLLELATPASQDAIHAILVQLVQRHPMLRARFFKAADGTMEHKLFRKPERSFAWELRPEQSLTESKSTAQILAKGLGRPGSPVFGVALFGSQQSISRVALLTHRAAVDPLSRSLILRDFERMLSLAPCSPLSEEPTYFDWIRTDSKASREEIPSQPLESAGYVTATAALDADTTSELLGGSCHEALRTEPCDVLCAALQLCLQSSLPKSQRDLRFRVTHDARTGSKMDYWNGLVGCFDQSSHLSVQWRGNEEERDVVRRFKDARRGYQERTSSLSMSTSPEEPLSIVADFTELRPHREAESPVLHHFDPYDLSAQQVDLSSILGHSGILLSATWTDSRLICAFTSSPSQCSQGDLVLVAEMLQSSIDKVMAALRGTSVMATLSEFPSISWTYPQLDSFVETQLNQISNEWITNIEAVHPCSTIQEKCLLGQAIDPAAYQCSFGVKLCLSDGVDTDRLSAAWCRVVSNSSILRTVFVDLKDSRRQFAQVVLRHFQPLVLAFDATEDRSLEVLDTRSSEPFGRFQVPHRLTVVRRSGHEVLLKLDVSHALIDGHCAELLLSKVSAAYLGFDDGLEQLPYFEYAKYQEQQGTSDSAEYWARYLTIAESTQIPVTTEQALCKDLKTLNFQLELSNTCSASLYENFNATVANACQVAWGLVLKCLVGRDNVSFSLISALRHLPLKGIMEAVGPYVTTLVCNMDLAEDARIGDILRRANDDYARSMSFDGEFPDNISPRQWGNSVMSFRRKLAQDKTKGLGLDLEMMDAYSPTDFDLSFVIQADDTSLDVNMDFWLSRIDEKYAKVILATFRKALSSVLQSPDGLVADVDLQPQDHLSQVLEWNQIVPPRTESCVHDLVDVMIHQQPSAPAVDAWDGLLTYEELGSCARLLAGHLLATGARPETMIGLCMSKSKWAVVAMLAALQAGAAVVPLGIEHPLQRIQTILRDSATAAVLVDEAQSRRLVGVVDNMIVIDESFIHGLISPPPSQQICTTVRPQNAAWVVYTSGSTAAPKGVLLEHSALSSSMKAHGTAFSMGSHARVLQFAAYTFDAAIQEIFTTLIFGGCICVPSEDERINNLANAISTRRVNFLGLTSSTASVLDPRDLPPMNKIVLFGEPLKAKVFETWLGHAPIHNGYGPTECSIFSSCSKPLETLSDTSIIGHPLSCNFWVIDPCSNYKRLMPVGLPGELLIEGPLLARGYINDPAKTDAAFITDPNFVRLLPKTLQKGRRMYRTGDLVQQLPDGSLIYLGRRDALVKIRGQRLDVGEPEYWISKLRTDITSVVVDIPSGQSELVAAVEFSRHSAFRDEEPSLAGLLLPSTSLQEAFNELQTLLFQKLPTYMVPTAYVPLVRMPLTISGKTDRRAVLTLLNGMSSFDIRQYLGANEASKTMPATETEKYLQSLWSSVLGIEKEQIGTQDHFLHIGGDSISAIRLVQEAQALNLSLKVGDIFRNPRLSDLSALIEEQGMTTGEATTDADYAAFELWKSSLGLDNDQVEQRLTAIASQCGILTEQIENVYPCTPLQEALMAVTMQNPTAYISRQVFELDPTIDMHCLRAAWESLAEAAPILRTRIILGRETLQVVLKGPLAWSESDNLQGYLKQDRARGISQGEPLTRFCLAQDATTGKRFFVWTAHHSAYDGWTVNLMYKYVINYYQGNTLPRSVQYERFVEYVNGVDRVATQDYWRKQLEGDTLPSFPALPYTHYRPRPSDHLYRRLPAMSKTKLEVPLSTILRGAWALAVAQYTGMEESISTVTVSGRSAPVKGVADIIAPTIATVPVRVRIDHVGGVRDYLSALHAQSVGMIPFEHTGMQCMKELLPELGPTLAINNHFVVQPADESDHIGGFSGMNLVVDSETQEAFDYSALTIECKLETDGNNEGATINARFDSFVVSREQVAIILHQFTHMVGELSSAAATGNTPLNKLDHLNLHDKNLIRTWNERLPEAVDSCVHDLITATVEKQPQAVAVEAWDGAFTYAELHEHARRLAHHLVTNCGVRPDLMVGMCMDKSKWATVAMLAILHAGGAVVPLAVQHPPARLRAMLDDCGAETLLVDAAQASRLAEMVPHIVPVEEYFQANHKQADSPSSNHPSSQHAAWVIYTSGSTGNPKGVVLEHAALCSSLLAHGAKFGMDTTSRVFQFATHAFDATIQEVCTTLIYGGCICVPSEDERMSIHGLTSFISTFNVSHLGLTSTTASLLQPGDLPSVRQIILFGEAVKPSVVEAWLGFAEILNAYGPSECSIHSACSQPLKRKEDTPIIGSPICACFWVADVQDYNNLCPIGAVGELLIEGPQLAREYLKDPAKTAKAFVTDPAFVSHLGLQKASPRRMYRTGDLVRQGLDGQLTYLGRRDAQVKINGQRLDTGEIEYWVEKLLSGVRSAVVDLVPLEDGKPPVLVATMDFVMSSPYRNGTVLEEFNCLAPSEILQGALTRLRSSLEEKLPAYMVPTLFVPMATIPLTATGKTDRRSTRGLISTIGLAQMRLYLGSTVAKEMPGSEMGRKLQMLWAEALRLDVKEIGAHDNFLQLGGDSIRAIQLVEAARKVDIHLTVAMILQHPRLSDLAIKLAEQTSDPTDYRLQDSLPFSLWQPTANSTPDSAKDHLGDIAAACEVSRDQIEDVYPCSPLQEAVMAVTMVQPDAYISRRTFALADDVDAVRLYDAWQTMAQAAPVLRTRILPQPKGDFVQVVVRAPIVWKFRTDLSTYLMEDHMRGIHYGLPLVRCALIQEPTGHRYFVWTAHHSIYDGWSLQLLYRQVAEIYRDGIVPRQVPYTRFIRYLQQTDTESTRHFWQETLAGDGIPASIPVLGHRQNKVKTVEHLQHRLEIDTASLTNLGAGLSNILRAAWSLVISLYTGASDVAFAVAVSGRTTPVMDITDMVAPTIATIPVRVRIDRTASVHDFVATVQQQSISAMPYEHTGLQRIRKLVPELAALLEINHLFVVQPATESEGILGFPGLEPIDEVTSTPFHDYAFVLECTLPDGESNEITANASFDERTVSSTDVKSMLVQLEHVLREFGRAVTEQPNRALDSLERINPQDAAQLCAWNAHTPGPAKSCVHDLISTTMNDMPTALAVNAYDGCWTYNELDTQAMFIANYLMDEGVGLGHRVGVCMDKSRWAPVAMLAILRVGAAVVPLGVQYPLSRITQMSGDSEISIILADQHQAERLLNLGPRLVVVDMVAAEVSRKSSSEARSVLPAVEPTQAAWIIYTSGSTGTPKGVVLDHRALSSSIQAHGPAFGMKPKVRVFQFAAHTFDVAIQEICTTLVYGGCICIPSEEERIGSLAETIARQEVQILGLTASTALLIRRKDVPTVERLVLFGEPVKASIIDAWRGVEILSAYGISEASIHSTCSRPLLRESEAASIGAPLGCTFWITDPLNYHNLCPIGAIGELLIEGPTIAQGYLNDLVKTQSSFVVDPAFVGQLSLSGGRRMYRTGDLVRQTSRDSFTYVGRRDTQVKIRGQRLDVRETEHWVQKLIEHAVTVVVEVVPPGLDRRQPMLVAAMDFQKDSPYTDASLSDASNLLPPTKTLQDAFSRLRESLQRHLPAYMVPNVYVPLLKVPLNASSKTDRRAVREKLESFTMEQLRSYASEEVTGPKSIETEAEQLVRALWAKVLELDPISIGRYDNFFDLGGDSIAVMRLVATASARGTRLSVKTVFEAPQLLNMAAAMGRGTIAEPVSMAQYQPFSLFAVSDLDKSLTELQSRILQSERPSKNSIVDVLPATDPQAINVVGALTRAQVEVHHFQIHGQGSDVSQLIKACQGLAEHLEIFRTVYTFYDKVLVQVVLALYEAEIALLHIDGDLDTAVDELIRERRSTPLLLGQPLVHMTIVNQAKTQQQRVLFRMSHAAYDGSSFPIIWNALQSIYNGYLQKGQPNFSSYVFDMQSRITADTYQYWQRHLQGSTMPRLNLSKPQTSQSPNAMAFCGTKKVAKAPSLANGITNATYVKSAWALILSECLGTKDIVFGDTISGRSVADTSVVDAVGCCATHLPFRISIQRNNWNVMDLLCQMRDLQSDRIPHEAMGFREIIRSCTSWPTSTRFTSIVNHRRALPTSMHLGAREFSVKTVIPADHMNLYDIAVVADEHDDHVGISLGYAEDALSQAEAQILLSTISKLTEIFVRSPESAIHDIFHGMKAEISLLRSRLAQANNLSSPASQAVPSPAQMVSNRVLEEMWHFVLDQKRGVPGASFFSSPFSDLGGDLQDAAQLAFLMQQKGMNITVDDVLEHPSLMAMTQLLNRQ